MRRSLSSVAEAVQAQLVGDGAVEVSGVASIAQASPADLVFVEDEKHLRFALESRAAAVIVGEFAAEKDSAKPMLISTQPNWHFRVPRSFFFLRPIATPGFIPARLCTPRHGWERQ